MEHIISKLVNLKEIEHLQCFDPKIIPDPMLV